MEDSKHLIDRILNPESFGKFSNIALYVLIVLLILMFTVGPTIHRRLDQCRQQQKINATKAVTEPAKAVPAEERR